MITTDELKHIAKLAKLSLSEDEIAKYSKELGSILDFLIRFKKVDTDNVPETSQVTGLETVTQADVVEVNQIEDDLLECTPHSLENHCIKIPRVL